jgi:hypothetical protein
MTRLQLHTPVHAAAALGFILLGLLLAAVSASAAVAAATPADLEVWSDWVVRDVEDFGCPRLYDKNARRCGYPGYLVLNLDSRSGSFTQEWRVYREVRVYLPGNREHWPIEVSVDDAPVAVVDSKGHPAITLTAGRHTVSGSFRWSQLPESLVVPPDSGLVTLQLAGTPVARPDIRNGQLWLSVERTQAQSLSRTDIKVFRKISDEVPLLVTTRIELEVSGDQRELALDGALLQGLDPVALYSRLPARLDASGRLLLKVRPGRWVVNVDARLNRETLALDLDSFPAPWPSTELWVFDARPRLRMLRVTSPASIDAAQSGLPEDWKQLPAYPMQAGTSMQFEQVRRGDPEPEPDRLALKRELWLDFGGDSYSVSDHISGTMSRGWRINASAGLVPGQVTLDGKPQLITRADDGAVGVEVRQGNIKLDADSRIVDSVRHISAVGWDHDFNNVSASINVPPGYRVLAISGADRSPSTWLSRWTLLDFFIVLITSIALSKLYGLRWGLLGLVGLVALWHEPGAPTWIWLNLIATLSLMRVVRDTRVYPLARNYLVLSSLALLLLALPFMVDQVRNGIYPQLEHAWQSMGEQAQQRPPAAQPAPVAEQMALMRSFSENASDRLGGLASSLEKRYPQAPVAALDKLLQDPDAKLQTGPGLPEWNWRSYPVTWNGPVQKQQRLSVYFVSPFVNLLLNLFRVGIVLLLAWKLLRVPLNEWLPHGRQAATTASLILLAGTLIALPDPAVAAYPPQELLQALRERLLEPADCLPHCAELERLTIGLDPGQARFGLRIHAAENTSLPLPVPLNDWVPSGVSVDGEPAVAMFRDSNNTLWLYLEAGVHDVVVQGSVARLRSLRLDFPLPPHVLELELDGWSSDGADELQPVLRSLTFTREQKQGGTDTFDTRSEIPAFAHVTRHLRMGLDWQLVTTVRLESGTALPALLRIPLLEGEAVVSDDIRVEDDHAVVSLSETSPSANWLSSLPQSDSLRLTAAVGQPWSETWSMEITPIWNVRFSGIPVIYHQQADGQWQPQWRPWPGEQVQLAISRPRGIEGQTLTVDRSQLLLTPGKRATAAELTFTLRSSQGQQHGITLPDGAQLESVSIDGKALPIRQDGRDVTLPLKPGSQDIVLQWKQSHGIDWWFASPPVDLGIASVNARVVIKPGFDRWVLLTGGIRQGPAVLFWGVLIVVVLIALVLGRVKDTPLNTGSWILLGIGLSTVTPFSALLIAAWIFALYGRGRITELADAWRFNAMQIGLVMLTVVSVVALFGAVSNGLLGNPEMQIAGNGSSHNLLKWYQDRIDSDLPRAWIISLPVLAYRFMMLAWSMWMAFALIKWLKWGWGCFSSGRLWMPRRKAAVNKPQHAGNDPAGQ